jgi:hypothetical protein
MALFATCARLTATGRNGHMIMSYPGRDPPLSQILNFTMLKRETMQRMQDINKVACEMTEQVRPHALS